MASRRKRLRKRIQRHTRPYKARIQSFEGRLRRQRVIHVIHIGKTGGIALKEAIRGDIRGVQSVYQGVAPGTRIVTHSHRVRLVDVPSGDDVVVVLRDPVGRFVSGFNSRRRQGMPNHFNPWTRAERSAFERFTTPDELAAALSEPDPERRAEAEAAMAAIGHVRTRLADWLGSPELIRQRKDDFLLVGWQETLAEDYERLRASIGLPDDRQLPADPKVAHKAPSEQATTLGSTAIANLRAWYRSDDALIDAMVAMGLTSIPEPVRRRRREDGVDVDR